MQVVNRLPLEIVAPDVIGDGKTRILVRPRKGMRNHSFLSRFSLSKST